MPAIIAVAEGIESIAFLQRSIFYEVHVADTCKTDLADHVLLHVDFFRSSVLGWSPRHELACTFCSFEWACPQAKSFAVWVRQDWLICLELSELSGIQSNIDSKVVGNFCECFLSKWNKSFGSCSFHSDLGEA